VTPPPDAPVLGEFELIHRYFERPGRRDPGVALGIGDDCALLEPAPGQQLAVSTDMLVEGRHFFADVDPVALGHKALAVNLSDLAAMGAAPLGFTLALALPRADEAWLAGFTQGLFALADASGCPLVGGDTTRGPLNLSLTVFGQVPAGRALRRAGARAGDDVWVSGTVGDARLALEALLGAHRLDTDTLARTRRRLEWPIPRLTLGQALRGIATAAADVSDGLLGDLGHILKASGCGATIDVQALLAGPAVSDELRRQPGALARTCALAGGDDYELVFTAPPAARDAVQGAGHASGTPVTRIGQLRADPGVQLRDTEGPGLAPPRSFDHFA
jgi:thiamine-monophosphate kinase